MLQLTFLEDEPPSGQLFTYISIAVLVSQPSLTRSTTARGTPLGAPGSTWDQQVAGSSGGGGWQRETGPPSAACCLLSWKVLGEIFHHLPRRSEPLSFSAAPCPEVNTHVNGRLLITPEL